MKLIRYIYSQLTEDLLLLSLMIGFVVLIAMMPGYLKDLPQLVEWNTIAILVGLIILSRGLEDSGALTRAGLFLLTHMHTERKLAVAIVIFSALLSAVVTNDVALFIVVPLTLGLNRVAKIPVGKLVIFEALAVNAGSAASPIGNPQNLYLWQLSNDSFMSFLTTMLPISLWMLLVILLLAIFAFKNERVELNGCHTSAPLLLPLFYLSLLSYPIFLILVELNYVMIGVSAVLIVFLAGWRKILWSVDWQIILIFILMFIVLGLLAKLPIMAVVAQYLIDLPGHEVTAAILLSQVISNVPATLFLSEFTQDGYKLAWGANVGGFGLAIGSLANLIALRLSNQQGLGLHFHAWSIPVLLLSSLGAFFLAPWFF
ncbi:SLC13 family permease [Nitrincola tibetensis]|nr:SLC13 family permease [Nitrincola tibetensis]